MYALNSLEKLRKAYRRIDEIPVGFGYQEDSSDQLIELRNKHVAGYKQERLPSRAALSCFVVEINSV